MNDEPLAREQEVACSNWLHDVDPTRPELRLCEPAELQKCPVCGRRYCAWCVYRVGSRSYCSRPCGDSFFFGGEVDDEEIPEE